MLGCEYWNDIEIEKTKPYWIEDESDMKLLNFIQKETNLHRCFQDALDFTNHFYEGVKGHVLDVGAGVAWTSAILSKLKYVESVTAIDYSEHRLKEVAPIVFSQLGGGKNKFKSIIGDFLEINLPLKNYDTIVFCQSLYMFPHVDAVLKKVSDILAPDGLVLVACERITPEYPIYSFNHLKKILVHAIKGRADSSGNQFYVDKDYRNAIENAGLNYEFQLLDYPLYPKNNTWKTGNHFGIKAKG
ncbi:class I SAM-dependent methyltransferase [Candidatus Pacearchaeota archaeon]|nr:class I SAM-dependent methyltransferase [Candidatus Pacearchaeota archaeon]